MARFLVRRVLLGALVLWLVSLVVFAIFFVDPAGPDALAHRLAGKNATVQMVAQVKHRLGLDQSVPVQYWHFLWGSSQQNGLLKGSLGYSFQNGVSVNSIVKQAFPITLSLAIGAAILWLAMGLLSGILSAVRPRTMLDRTFTGIALFFYSLPTFVLGSLLLLSLYYYLTKYAHLQWFPATGYVNFTDNPGDWARHLVLPWFTLAAVTAAAYTRLTRGSMLDVLGEDYIRTARAKGLPERRVVFRHALRAALTPVVTQFGIDLGTLVGGAIVTEKLFGLPGLGFTAINAIEGQDLPVILGITMLAATAIVVANLLVDVLYAVLDPRVRLH
ncbi:MAG TPA: ABC transporter permease [Mycobacteriales bacterium]|nr:ABC transporter permease [Mycobacteriales bacterium]